jgi:hypothetical protein
MKTKDNVNVLGLYATDCCGEELIFDVQEQLSQCPSCDKGCSWNFVERVIPWQELEGLEPLAA